MFQMFLLIISFFGGMTLQPGEVVIPGKYPVVVVTNPRQPPELEPSPVYTYPGNGN